MEIMTTEVRLNTPDYEALRRNPGNSACLSKSF